VPNKYSDDACLLPRERVYESLPSNIRENTDSEAAILILKSSFYIFKTNRIKNRINGGYGID
jgi:hypothetical protein